MTLLAVSAAVTALVAIVYNVCAARPPRWVMYDEEGWCR